jgi:hypothetical protein
LLITIGLKGNFTAISIFDVNAHGHAQIFGWVGLFVMGFAYQAFPRFKHTSLWNPRLALLTFYLMLTGLILRVVGEPLHLFTPLFWLAVLGTVLEVLAIGLFIVIIAATLRRSQNRLMAYDYYFGVAFFWFFAQAVLDLFHLYMTTMAPTKAALLAQVAADLSENTTPFCGSHQRSSLRPSGTGESQAGLGSESACVQFSISEGTAQVGGIHP